MDERRDNLQATADDSELRTLVESGDIGGAATRFMERYGGEILALLVMRLRSESAAAEVFSDFTEDFWRGLAGFWRIGSSC